MAYHIPIEQALAGFLYSSATVFPSVGDEYGADDDSADEIEDYLEEMDEDVDRPQEQKLHEHYSMEKQDPTHRMGDLMTAAETIYNEARGGRRRDEFNARGQDFITWLDKVPEWTRVVMIKETLQAFDKRRFDTKKAEGITPSMVKAFISGVKYLDKAGRKNYRIEPRGGRLWKGNVGFDTDTLQTAFSGLGFAIWVLSPKDKFYAGSHKVGQFHHSSFLSGEKVLGAGEMVVQGGKLRLLTGKSGHYKPQLEHLVYAVDVLRKQSIDLSSFRVQIWRTQCSKPEAPTAQEFLNEKAVWKSWSGCNHPAHVKLQRADWDR